MGAWRHPLPGFFLVAGIILMSSACEIYHVEAPYLKETDRGPDLQVPGCTDIDRIALAFARSQLTVEPRPSPGRFAKTEWAGTGIFVSKLAYQERRIRFWIFVEGSECRVIPEVQTRARPGLQAEWSRSDGGYVAAEKELIKALEKNLENSSY